MSAAEAWEKVRDNSDPTNWVLLGFDANKKIAVQGQGSGGLKEFVSQFAADKALFGGLRVHAIDERGSVTSTRVKFVLVQWIGENVNAMLRGRFNMQRGDFENVLKGCHMNLQTSDVTDLTEERLRDRLQAATGAHKPSGYDFNPGLVETPGSPAPASPTPVSPIVPKPVEEKKEEKPVEEKKEEKPVEEKKEEPKPVEEEKKEPPASAPKPPPPPPPGPPPPPPVVAPAGDAPKPAASAGTGAALFAEINSAGLGITSGLRKVTDDQKVYKQTREEGYSLIRDDEAEKMEAPKAAPKPAAKAGEKKGEPKHELVDRRWTLEWQEGKRNEYKEFTIDETTKDQSVYIYKCSFITVKVVGKINALQLVGCKRVDVQFDDLISAAEVTGSQNINLQVTGSFPSGVLENSSDINVYLSKASLETEFTTTTTSGLNITVPALTDDGEPKELPVPSQFVSKFEGRKLITKATEHV